MTSEDDASVVLVMRDHPALSSDYIRHTLGEAPQMPENIANSLKATNLNRPLLKSTSDVIKALEIL